MAGFLQLFNVMHWIRRRRLIKNPNGLKHFGENCLTDFKRTAISDCDKIDGKLKELEDTRAKLTVEKSSIEKEAVILDRNDFHSVASHIHRFTFFFWVLLLGETGLNLFTMMICMPPSENKGLIFWFFRGFLAFAITCTSFLGASIVFKELLPKHKYHSVRASEATNVTSPRPPSPSIIRSNLILGSIILIVAEVLIYYLGLERVSDLAGSNINMVGSTIDKNIAIAFILLSMIIPIGIAYLQHEIEVYFGAYKNRLGLDALTAKIHSIENEIVHRKSAMNAIIEEEIEGRWGTLNTFRVQKENFNAKRSPPIEEDLSQFPYFERNQHSAFRQECLKRWLDAIAQHPENATPIALKTLMDKMIAPMESIGGQKA